MDPRHASRRCEGTVVHRPDGRLGALILAVLAIGFVDAGEGRAGDDLTPDNWNPTTTAPSWAEAAPPSNGVVRAVTFRDWFELEDPQSQVAVDMAIRCEILWRARRVLGDDVEQLDSLLL